MVNDTPRRLTALVARATPGDWGRAMLAELDHVEGARARWSFALGATRVAAFPPVAHETALAVAAAAGLIAFGVARWPGVITDGVAVAVAYLVALALLLAAYLRAPAALGRLGSLAVACSCLSLVARTLGFHGSLVLAGAAWVASLVLLALVGRDGGARAGLRVGAAIGLSGFIVILAVTYLSTGSVAADPVYAAEFRASGASDLTTYAVGETMASAVHQLWIGPATGALLGAFGGAFTRRR